METIKANYLADVIGSVKVNIDNGDNKGFIHFKNGGMNCYELFRIGQNSIVYDTSNNQIISVHGLMVTGGDDVVTGEWDFAFAYYDLNECEFLYKVIDRCLLDVSGGVIQ